MKNMLSPKELAEAIGASESSLKRWTDDGLIKASRTAGGHRRISIAEAIRFIRETNAPLVRPEILGLKDITTLAQTQAAGVDTVSEAEQLFAHLDAGRDAEARGVILSLYLAGQSVAEILDGPVATAMRRLGQLWHDHDDGILREHRATDICIQALNQLRLLIPLTDGGPIALGAAPAGDPYLIPSLGAAIVLSAAGFAVTNLGPNTPVETVQKAAIQMHPRLVWLSLSHVPDAAQLAPQVEALARGLAQMDAALVIGGSACKTIALPRNSNVHAGASMLELAAFAHGLATVPSKKAEESAN